MPFVAIAVDDATRAPQSKTPPWAFATLDKTPMGSMSPFHPSFSNLSPTTHSPVVPVVLAMLLNAAWVFMFASLHALTTEAVPVAALKSLVVLTGVNSAPPCVAATLPSGFLIASSDCPLDNLERIQAVADVSFLEGDAPNIQLKLKTTATPVANVSVAWSNSNTTHVLRYGVDLKALRSRGGSAATIVVVDAKTLRVSAIDAVVYVDDTLCGSSTSTPSVCVLPLNVQDRDAVASQASFRFLVKHDVTTGTHTLLGLGLPPSDNGNDDGFQRFSWLAASLQDTALARLLDLPLPEADRLFVPSLTKTDATTTFVVDIRDASNTTACTGVLIAPRVVLTSRQCEGSKVTTVRLGGTDKTILEVLPVFSYLFNKRYNGTTGAYDGLVIRLAKPSSRTPLALVSDTSTSAIGQSGRVFGYGVAYNLRLGKPLFTQALRSMDVAIGPSNALCSSRVGRSLDDSKVCAGSTAASTPDGCFNAGDVGAPLVVGADTTTPRLVGVLFDGRACGDREGLSVFTRAASMMTLVREAIKRSNTTTTKAPATGTGRAFEPAVSDVAVEETLVVARSAA